jgi:hypothetical protein
VFELRHDVLSRPIIWSGSFISGISFDTPWCPEAYIRPEKTQERLACCSVRAISDVFELTHYAHAGGFV